MGSFFVIIQSPNPGHFSYLADALKQIRIEELSTERAVEAFNEAVLLWFAWLDINQFDIVCVAPIRQCC